MTDAADLLLTNAEVHSLTDPDVVHEAVAVRDGRIVRVGDAYEVEFLAGVETDVADLDGRVLLPGFVDAHTHLPTTGRYLVNADLSEASDRAEALDALRERTDEVGPDEWVLGFGYDESAWPEREYLSRHELDAVDDGCPVVAVRQDMHTASLNTVALERLQGRMPDGDLQREAGEPTGVVVEEAADVLWEAIAPDVERTTELVRTAAACATELGVTAVHDMVRDSHAPRVYRDLAAEGDLPLRVRINYWSDHLDAVLETGLRTNAGSDRVRTGAIKTFTDGSFGGRTAKVSEPYADAPDDDPNEGRGRWVVHPGDLRELVSRVEDVGLQMTAHAIGDEAVDAVLDAYEDCEDPGAARHRVEHAELASDEAMERFAETGVVASVQPNFLKWAGEGGLYADRLGERRTETNRFRDLLDAGVHLAFGSDCMPLDPLLGVHHAVNAPEPAQRLTVTEALRAYTLGGSYAGFDEDRTGTIEVGKRADLVALERSPWTHEASIRDIDVAATVVDGEIVHENR